MSEMTAVEYLKEWARMVKHNGDCCRISCSECPLSNYKGIACQELKTKYPERTVSIVQKWAAEHPRKTMLMDLLEKYPKMPLNDAGLPFLCPYDLGYEASDCADIECMECWNRPLDE